MYVCTLFASRPHAHTNCHASAGAQSLARSTHQQEALSACVGQTRSLCSRGVDMLEFKRGGLWAQDRNCASTHEAQTAKRDVGAGGARGG